MTKGLVKHYPLAVLIVLFANRRFRTGPAREPLEVSAVPR
jgi:hypothetical protein